MNKHCTSNLVRKTFGALGGACLLGLCALPAAAADVSLSVPALTKYIWRGIEANSEPVLQPSLTVAGSGLTFNLWGNMDLTGSGEETGYGNRAGEFTEIDLTGEYAYTLGPVSLAAGVISYIFPGIAATTHEVYGRISSSVPSNPFLAVYSDVDEIKGSYFQLGVSHTQPLELGPLTGVSLGATAGYGSATYNRGYFGIEKAAPVDLAVTLSLPLALPANLTLTPSYTFSYLLDQEISDTRSSGSYSIFALGLSSSL